MNARIVELFPLNMKRTPSTAYTIGVCSFFKIALLRRRKFCINLLQVPFFYCDFCKILVLNCLDLKLILSNCKILKFRNSGRTSKRNRRDLSFCAHYAHKWLVHMPNQQQVTSTFIHFLFVIQTWTTSKRQNPWL